MNENENENEIKINDIYERLKKLEEKCEVLEKEKIVYEEKDKKNQDNFYNLIEQIKLLKKDNEEKLRKYSLELKSIKDESNKTYNELQKKLNDYKQSTLLKEETKNMFSELDQKYSNHFTSLKESLNKEFDNKYIVQMQNQLDIIKQNIENEIEKYKTLNNDINNELKDLKKKYEEIDKIIEQKFERFKNNINQYIGRDKNIIPENKEEIKNEIQKEKKEEIKVEKKEQKKEQKIVEEDKQFKEMTLMEKLQSTLFKIFLELSPDIDIDDINKLKKISSALLMRKKTPIEVVGEFLNENFNDNAMKDLNDEQKINLANKKTKIFTEIKDISLINTINTMNLNDIINKFEKKYGITLADVNYKDFVREIQLYKYDEIKILKAILKKLKYLTVND